MQLGVRGKLFAISLLLIVGVGLTTAAFLEWYFPGETLASARRELVLLAALAGLAIAVFMSGIAAEIMTRAFRSMIQNAVDVATGETHGSIPPRSGERGTSGPLHRMTAELEEAVSELAAERDRLETILERMSDAVLALDAEGRITIANTAAFEVLDFDDDDVGRPLLEAVRLPVLLELSERAIEQGDASSEFELPKPPHRNVLAKAAPLKTIGGVVIVMHDVTDVRRLESMRRDFVANVSHELRTPIAIIRANAETLLDGALDDPRQGPRFVEAMHRNAERLSRLIADLLDLSRIEAGQYAANLRPLDLREAVDAILDSLEAKASSRDIAISSEIEPGLGVVADSTGLGQVLQNLLDNAIKYTPEGGHVTVRAEPRDDRLRIEVEDDGPGIEPHHRHRVFERFYRVDTGRSRDLGGTGLGLSIVKHLTEQMRGRVGVKPAARRGTIFWVDLPAATLDTPESIPASRPRTKSSAKRDAV